MNAMIVLLGGLAILVIGYVLYGGWLAKQWGVCLLYTSRCV